MNTEKLISSDRMQISRIAKTRLKADCSACQAICCTLPAFDDDQGFAYNKEACTPCRNLNEDMSCNIHDDLLEDGFASCISYDCFGAGQRISKLLKLEATWFDKPALTQEVYEHFTRAKSVHELMALLILSQNKITEGETINKIARLLNLFENISDVDLLKMDNGLLQHLQEQTHTLIKGVMNKQASEK